MCPEERHCSRPSFHIQDEALVGPKPQQTRTGDCQKIGDERSGQLSMILNARQHDEVLKNTRPVQNGLFAPETSIAGTVWPRTQERLPA